MERGMIQKLFDGIRRLFEPLLREWDGSASNYDSTEAYCSACLIDVNGAAGNDEKAQSHCMLPVKSPGSDSYNWDGIKAAAGGHGVTQVKKPDDVPEDEWAAAVKAAANTIIGQYNAHDEVAPDSVYEAAGKEAPERAVSLGSLYGQVDAELWDMESFPWLHDLYLDDGGAPFAIVSERGKLYQVPLTLQDDGTVQLGEFVQVVEEFKPVEPATRTRVFRQKDGRVRWMSISATSVLNRVGEIDSTALFDSFVAHAQETGEYPYRCFFHQGEAMRTGQADFMARDGNTFITSGLYDEDNPLADAEIEALERDGDHWGESIHFRATEEPQLVEVARDVTIPVYTAGVMVETSVLPEDKAAGWFTRVSIQEVDRAMRQDVLDALVDLCDGDEERANEFAALVDGTNRDIGEGNLIARAADTGETVTEPPAMEPVADAEPQEPVAREVELDAEAVEAITASFAEMLQPLTERVDGLAAALQEMGAQQEERATADTTAREALGARLEALERDDDERQREWLEDLPRNATERLRVTYRPREQEPANGRGATLADQAHATMAAIRGDA